MDKEVERIIATLGPEGTCSEMAAQYYGQRLGGNYQVKLYMSFEEAINSLKEQRSTYVIIPSAYKKIANTIFKEKNYVQIEDVFIFDTPEIVFATNRKRRKIRKIATQSSPKSLLEGLYEEEDFIDSDSNSRSALMVMEGLADACLTTMICAQKYSMNIIENFGAVHMGWNVFAVVKDL